ncbi:MAG: DUF2062 domain-containing protein [Halieaceae bacterium]|nr:DUF2062 domain-containing protein [Halieaceae bacterium]MCP5146615.1 DUF2062 domain-containing protein [Pseudomonadales bacterium]MCP5166518.1 DUF2062 domain-containing protein [Pseudomonadales bacterium]MCP5186413.1 DUF2062 domain-containing protein [Pseudomonadales bacterium]
MPKKTLKSIMPSVARIREIKSLRFLGDWIYETNLWHINRYSASMAFFVGLFIAFMPIPGQMVVAALFALLLRCNLPLSICLVWVTNPLTMPALFFMAYEVGALIVDVPVTEVKFALSFHWLTHTLISIWQPFLLGCLLCGLFFGCLGYFVVSLSWRWRVAVHWKERQRRRANKRASDPG